MKHICSRQSHHQLLLSPSTCLYLLLLLLFFISLFTTTTAAEFNVWQQLDTNHGVPTPRSQQAMAVTRDDSRIFMFFGYDWFAKSLINESWVYDRNTGWWQQFPIQCSSSTSSCITPRTGSSIVTTTNPQPSGFPYIKVGIFSGLLSSSCPVLIQAIIIRLVSHRFDLYLILILIFIHSQQHPLIIIP